MAAQRNLPNQEAFDRALKYFEEARKHHGDFVRQVEDRYKAYRAVLDNEDTDEMAGWTYKLHPPYIMHIVETSLANLVDDHLRWRIKPKPSLDFMIDPTLAERARLGAKAHDALFRHQAKANKFTRVQRPFCLQNQIAGLSVAKTYWVTEEQRRRKVVQSEEPIVSPITGEPLVDPLTMQPLTRPKQTITTGTEIVYDGPITEVRDVRDFLWNESAVSLEKARYVIDRVWMNKEDIEAGFDGDSPMFGPDRGGWSKKDVLEALSHTRDFKEEFSTRETELFSIDRTKDLVEVVEVWDNVRGEVTTMANRRVLLAHRPFPFFHEKPPFVVCSTQPDLFRIPGVSQVEKIKHLQTMLWALQSQRITNLQLVNAAIFMFRSDTEDPDDFEFYPGARWLVEDPAQVQMWQPNVIPAEVSVGGEALLKGDLQNLAGGFPFTSGADSQTVDQKTATGASIVSSLAQRSINMAKQEVYNAWEDVGQQYLILNQQFITEPTIASVVGPDDQEIPELILPELLSVGDMEFEIEPVADSIAKQEEQASAQALYQLGMQAAGPVAGLAQAGAARMINVDALWEDLLQAFGKENTERYFSAAKPPMVQPAADGSSSAPPGGPEEPVSGVTAPQSIDPGVSPSAQISSAPSTLLHRALALSKGGGRSV